MDEKYPLVSVIAICYNHDKFLIECLQSVVNQTYSYIELIIVDDFSNDKSKEKIFEFIKKNPLVKSIFNNKNIGNCRSFNKALKISRGKYIIDLSTDDVLLPKSIEEQVRNIEKSEKIGVVFTDADYIDENSKFIGNIRNGLNLPIGNVYADVLAGRLYMMPVTMMMRRTILEQLNGYDEDLSYEDFDFWVRSSRICEFDYVPKILSYQRIFKGAYSTNFSKKNNHLTPSTIKVCEKAFLLNETEFENKALIIRLRMELLRCAFTENFDSGKNVLALLDSTKGHNWKTFIGKTLIFLKLPLNPIFRQIMTFRRFIRFK